MSARTRSIGEGPHEAKAAESPRAAFTFDALGRNRTRELGPLGSPSSTDTYSYVGPSETVTRISNSGGTVTDSLVDPIGDRLAVKVGATVNWLVPDLHGSVGLSQTADESKITNALRYDAYGETLATGTGSGAPAPVGEKHWKYQGRLDLSPTALATPLYDGGARAYSPGLGTFTSLDTVAGSAQNPLTMNRFLYTEANPATLIDPTGHCTHYIDGWCADHPAGGMTAGQQAAKQKHYWKMATAETRIAKAAAAKARQRNVLTEARNRVKAGEAMLPGGRDMWMRLEAYQADDVAHSAERLGPSVCAQNPSICLGVFGFGAGALAAAPAVGSAVVDAGAAAVGVVTTAAETVLAWLTGRSGGSPTAAPAAASSFGQPIIVDEAAATALSVRGQLQAAVDTVAARGPVALSEAQQRAAAANEQLRPLFEGFRFHQAVAQKVVGEFTYHYKGIDFEHIATGIRLELTTIGEVAKHLERYQSDGLTVDQIVTYVIPH